MNTNRKNLTHSFTLVFNNQSKRIFYLSFKNLTEETIAEIDKTIAEWDELAIESLKVFFNFLLFKKVIKRIMIFLPFIN